MRCAHTAGSAVCKIAVFLRTSLYYVAYKVFAHSACRRVIAQDNLWMHICPILHSAVSQQFKFYPLQDTALLPTGNTADSVIACVDLSSGIRHVPLPNYSYSQVSQSLT